MMNKTIKIFKIISIIALLFMLTVATSCKKTNNDKNKIVTVTFDTDGGNYIESKKILVGKKLLEIEEPVKNGYKFLGWYLNEVLFDINTPITEDCTLVAKWKRGDIEDMGKIIYAQIELSTGDKINLEIYPDKAPETVANFVKLANSDYYVGTIFHRIIEGFVIQAGGYYIDGDTLKELPETDKIKGEFLQNGFAYNSLEHLLGTISMARLPFDYNSATSQFFICAADCPTLDDEYAAFGRAVDLVSQGVVVNLSTIPTATLGTGFADFPTEIVSIVKVRIQDEAF